MITIIAGSRDITNYGEVVKAIAASKIEITKVVTGRARGVDELGETWAREHNIPVRPFPAQWNKYGKSAGYRRNESMAEYAEALIAVWDGKSKGTRNMIDTARKYGLKVYVHTVSDVGKE
jgi:glycerophosphoryl diester phosphodiesterase